MKRFSIITGLFLGAMLFSASIAGAVSIFQVQQGGSGAGTFTGSALITGNGTNAFYTTATTSVTCTGNTSCTPFTAIGASPITINSTALSGTYPILYNNGTGVISTAFSSSTLTASSPLTGSFAQVGSGGTLGIQVANTSQGGYLTNTDWNTFNGKGAGTVTSIIAGLGLNGGTISSSGTLSLKSYIATSSAETAGQLPYWTSTSGTPATQGSVGTSSIGVSAGLTNSGTLGSQVGGSSLTLKQVENRGFSYATSTAWTGTTTIPLGVAYGEVWNTVKCFTDTGTLYVDFYHASTHFNPITSASTTVGTNTMSATTNTSGDKVYVDIGNPASTPTKISCTTNDTN